MGAIIISILQSYVLLLSVRFVVKFLKILNKFYLLQLVSKRNSSRFQYGHRGLSNFEC